MSKDRSRIAKRIAYLDCFSGVSGDMMLAALFDAGASLALVNSVVQSMGIDCVLECSRASLAGIACRQVEVRAERERQCRHLKDVLALLEKGEMSEWARSKAKEVFVLLAEAEAKVHGCSVDAVHFHEVGAVDTIADVVGVLVALEALEIDELYCSPLPYARGWANCAHGSIPLPGPAVCQLLRDVPVYGVDLDAELVTPTGAVLVKALARDFGPMPECRIERVGYGGGSLVRKDGKPNLLRVVVGLQEGGEAFEEEIEVIETCIDDWHPEGVGYLTERLLSWGALDVVVTAVQMKKNRPGVLVRVLAELEKAPELKRLILVESTSIGLRYRKERRLTLERSLGTVATAFGRVGAKLVRHPDGLRLHPEFESCRQVALQKNVSLQAVYDAVACASIDDFKKRD